jgi:hypothetical protein
LCFVGAARRYRLFDFQQPFLEENKTANMNRETKFLHLRLRLLRAKDFELDTIVIDRIKKIPIE